MPWELYFGKMIKKKLCNKKGCNNVPPPCTHTGAPFSAVSRADVTTLNFRVLGWLKKLVLKTGFSKNWFSKKKKKQRNLEGKKKPTLFTRPFCECL